MVGVPSVCDGGVLGISLLDGDDGGVVVTTSDAAAAVDEDASTVSESSSTLALEAEAGEASSAVSCCSKSSAMLDEDVEVKVSVEEAVSDCCASVSPSSSSCFFSSIPLQEQRSHSSR